MQTKSIDTPLSEVNLRRYEKPYNLGKRELVRKLCLSLGLLNPGDSRDVVVDILYVLLEANKEKKALSSDEIRDEVIGLRRQEKLDDSGTAASNIRRQIRRLRGTLLVEKIKNDYRIAEFGSLENIFNEKVERFMIPSILERVREYLRTIDENFNSESLKNGKL
jgi:ribosome biogenesis GTPase A